MFNTERTPEVLKALVVLRRALRTGSTGEMEPKLPAGQVQVMLHLLENGPMPMGELALLMDISCPAATELVDRMVSSGRVERVSNPNDRRKVMVQLAVSSMATATTALAERKRKITSVLDQLSDQEAEGFVKGLKVMAQTLGGNLEEVQADSNTVEAKSFL